MPISAETPSANRRQTKQRPFFVQKTQSNFLRINHTYGPNTIQNDLKNSLLALKQGDDVQLRDQDT
uniref:Putative ovule protein n=1 Tax=Solanum chacoense TaxID=4108 RepID=A0A0V0GR02_SOLCH